MNNTIIYGKWKYIRYRTKRRFFLVIFLSIIILLLILLGLGDENFWGDASIIVAFLTLGVTLFVSYEQIREEWERDHLPKRFSGKFYYSEKLRIFFKNASLTTESDIRALAQQIGLQMVNQQLRFKATEIKVEGPKLNEEKKIVDYTISFNLIELPTEIKEGKMLVWEPPFTDKPKEMDISD